MTLQKSAWRELLSGFKCHVLGAHDWKRAVRTGASCTGIQRCRRCAAERAVELRPKEPASVTAARERAPIADVALPRSQWPAQ